MRLLFCALVFVLSYAIPLHAEPVSIGTAVSSRADVTVTGSATIVASANSARAFLSCTNTSSSVNVRWGDSAVTSSRGQRVPFGSSVQITNTGDVYMISEGANVTVSCTEETR